MERNPQCPAFSINRTDTIDLSFLPTSALLDCDGLILSLLKRKDIQEDIDQGVSPNGVSDRSPFLTPLVWIGLIYLMDWGQEKKLLRKMLLSKIDCNYIGLCGFNLFHFYLVQAILMDEGFEKLKWWVDKPMVDCNVFCLSLHERPVVTMSHPIQLVSKIIKQYPEHKKRGENVLLYIISRGASCQYLDEEWAHLPILETNNTHMMERKMKQQTKRQWVRENEKHLPTPQMNDLQNIPQDQHLLYPSHGILFRFHGSYMDPIIKTHLFPFTMEKIDPIIIEKWVCQFEDKWVPREEFLIGSPPFLCQDTHPNQDKLFINLLNNWVSPIYPYTRIIMLSTFPLTEKMYEYMCIKMRSGVFHLHPFHQKRTTSWKNFFLWSCYDSVQEFLFANQIEELVSQLEIFYSWTTPFLEEHPNVETFILLNSLGSNVYKIYSEEFDCSMYQVYHIFRKMFLFMKRP